jgi:hypothetical protein
MNGVCEEFDVLIRTWMGSIYIMMCLFVYKWSLLRVLWTSLFVNKNCDEFDVLTLL